MKKRKKSYCRCLCVILCALLFVPLLSAVPVFASSYDDLGYPPLPDLDYNSYPYIHIWYSSSTDTIRIYFTSGIGYGSGVFGDGGYVTIPGPACFLEYRLDEVNNEWELRYSSCYDSQIIAHDFIWANYDIYTSDGALWYKAADVVPTVPTLITSFDGQVISLDAGSLRFFITATNVNGTLSCQWFVNGAPISGQWNFIEAEPGVWLQGWVYTPVENGTREIYCIVTNTIGDKSESVSTGTVIVHYGVSGGGGSGDLTEVTDKLDVLDMEISDLKQSVEQVQEGIDSINDALTATDPALNDAVSAFDEGSAEVDAFERQQWQDFEQNSHVVTDQFQIFSDAGTMVGAFTLVSGIVHNTFNSLGVWQPVLTIPLAVGMVIFIWSRVPSKMNPNKHRDDKPHDPKSRDPNV